MFVTFYSLLLFSVFVLFGLSWYLFVSLSLLRVSSKSLLVFSCVFWRTHVSLRDVPFLPLSTPLFFFSIVVLFGLV